METGGSIDAHAPAAERPWIDRLGDLVRRCPRWVFGLALALATFLKNGWAIDGIGRVFSKEFVPALPHLPPWAPLYHYLFSSPIGAILARLLGIRSFGWFVALHLACLLVGLAAFFVRVQRVAGPVTAKVTLVALATSAVPTTLLQRLGGYDVFTVVLGGLVATAPAGWLGGLAGFGLAFSSFEQGVLGLLAVGVVRRIAGLPWRPMLPSFAGLMAGRLVLGVWLEWAGVQGSRLDWIRHFGVGMFLRMFAHGLPLFLLTATGAAGVIVVGVSLGADPETRRSLWWQFGAACVIALAATVLVDDQTRVFSLVWWPPMVALLLARWRAAGEECLLRGAVCALGVWLVIPPILISHGKPFLAQHHLLRPIIGG